MTRGTIDVSHCGKKHFWLTGLFNLGTSQYRWDSIRDFVLYLGHGIDDRLKHRLHQSNLSFGVRSGASSENIGATHTCSMRLITSPSGASTTICVAAFPVTCVAGRRRAPSLFGRPQQQTLEVGGE